jgi:hypothetical protein
MVALSLWHPLVVVLCRAPIGEGKGVALDRTSLAESSLSRLAFANRQRFVHRPTTKQAST